MRLYKIRIRFTATSQLVTSPVIRFNLPTSVSLFLGITPVASGVGRGWGLKILEEFSISAIFRMALIGLFPSGRYQSLIRLAFSDRPEVPGASYLSERCRGRPLYFAEINQ